MRSWPSSILFLEVFVVVRLHTRSIFFRFLIRLFIRFVIFCIFLKTVFNYRHGRKSATLVTGPLVANVCILYQWSCTEMAVISPSQNFTHRGTFYTDWSKRSDFHRFLFFDNGLPDSPQVTKSKHKFRYTLQ